MNATRPEQPPQVYDENRMGMGNAAMYPERTRGAQLAQRNATPERVEYVKRTQEDATTILRLRRVCNITSRQLLEHIVDESGNVRGGVPQGTIDMLTSAAKWLNDQASRGYDGASLPEWME